MRETIGLLRRTLARLDVSSRSMYAILEPGSCFAGTAVRAGAGRRPQLHAGAAGRESDAPKIALDGLNFGMLPEVNGRSRLETRFGGDAEKLLKLESRTRRAARAGRGAGTGSGHRRARRTRLGRRSAHRDRRARGAFARRADGAWKRACAFPATNPGDQGFRAAFGVAELGVHPAELDGRAWRAEIVRSGIEGESSIGRECTRQFSPLFQRRK